MENLEQLKKIIYEKEMMKKNLKEKHELILEAQKSNVNIQSNPDSQKQINEMKIQ